MVKFYSHRKFMLVLFLFFDIKWMNCDANAPQCSVTDPNNESNVYDLNSLARSGPWEVIDEESARGMKFYISICHPLNSSSLRTLCSDPGAAVCVTQFEEGREVPHTPNLGKPNSAPALEGNGRLTLTYDNGATCQDGGSASSFKTVIHFTCMEGVLDSGPKFINKIGKCEYWFVWGTEAACANNEHASSSTCAIPDANTDFLFSFVPLRSATYYSVWDHDTGDEFQLNLCGPVGRGSRCPHGSAICSVSKNNEVTDLGQANSLQLEYVEREIVMRYHTDSKSGNDIRAEIHFRCHQGSHRGSPEFVVKVGNTYEFLMETPVACTPKPVDCQVNDEKGNLYDLRPLAREMTNWEVEDGRSDHRTLRYHINVCRPINLAPGYTCPGGVVGACQTSTDHNVSVNLGYVQGRPFINSDGSVTVMYTGGSPCKNGSKSRSTRINLFCSHTEREPEFQTETDDCEYIFNWYTVVACPVQVVTGSECVVQEPLFGYLYDLTSLHNDTVDYEVKDDDATYYLNPCGPLHRTCAGSSSAGVCKVSSDGKQQTIAGQYNSDVVYNDGALTLDYENGTVGCKDGHRQASKIIFTCHHSSDEVHLSVGFLSVGDDCVHYFMWPTKLACPPFKVIECKVEDSGRTYDLSELSLSGTNYEVKDPWKKSRKYLINVCRSVVHTKDARCQYNSGVCQVNLHETTPEKKFENLGDVSGPVIEDGHLRIRYGTGDLCLTGSRGHKETVINFSCSKDNSYSEPEFLYEDNCEYFFEWRTSFACPQDSDVGRTSGDNCVVTNPYSGYSFDLSDLQKPGGYTIQDMFGHNLVVNVCGAVGNGVCEETAGSCIYSADNTSIHWSAGDANSRLMFDNGVLSLNYSHGEPCGRSGLRKNTLINFICGAEGVESVPVLVVQEGNCTYIVNWHTELACETRIPCTVDVGDTMIDLSPLIKTHGNYHLLEDSTTSQSSSREFYINVCRPLNHVPGLRCAPGSAACLLEKQDGKIINSKSMGHPHLSPILDGSGNVQMMYVSGAACPFLPNMAMTTKVFFKCRSDGFLGTPSLKDITHDCQYQFEWETRAACPLSSEAASLARQCMLKDSFSEKSIDLNILKKTQSYSVSWKDRKFTVDPCGTLPLCGGPVCENTTSFGNASSVTIDRDPAYVRLRYRGGSTCDQGVSQRATEIWFQCDPSAGLGQPTVYEVQPCFVGFLWRTTVVCTQTKSINVIGPLRPGNTGGVSEPMTTFNTAGLVVGLMLGGCALILVGLFVYSGPRKYVIAGRLKRVFGLSGGGDVHYTRVRTDDPNDDEGANLLFDDDLTENKSDDDELLDL